MKGYKTLSREYVYSHRGKNYSAERVYEPLEYSKFTLLKGFLYCCMGLFTPWGEYNYVQNGIKSLVSSSI
jgi:hypothetical protein